MLKYTSQKIQQAFWGDIRSLKKYKRMCITEAILEGQGW